MPPTALLFLALGCRCAGLSSAFSVEDTTLLQTHFRLDSHQDPGLWSKSILTSDALREMYDTYFTGHCHEQVYPKADQQLEAMKKTASTMPAQMRQLSGKHVVMIGDSVTRYQYLNLVHHFTYGSAPRFEYWKYDCSRGAQYSWNKFYNETNYLLNSGTSGTGKATCDCHRVKCCKDTFENRYFSDTGRSVHLTYIQWFYPMPFKGHWPSNGYPEKQLCDAGRCTAPASWQFSDVVGLLHDYVMHLVPTPTHVVMNSALWHLVPTDRFAMLLKAGQDIKQKTGTSFLWKTATHRYQQCCTFEAVTQVETRMARQYGWEVFDTHTLSKPLYAKDWAYADSRSHFSEVVYSYFNSAMLNLLK